MKEVKIGKRKEWENSISKKELVLDIGCWTGEKVKDLKTKGIKAFGMDIDLEKLKKADKNLKLKYGDVTKKIPFKEKFDWVIFGEVLEHVSDDKKAIKNISNSLKKGGKLILTTPRSVKYFQIWDPAWFRWKFLRGQKHDHYSFGKLKNLLLENNLEINEFYILGNLRWVFSRWFTVIMNYIFKIKGNFFPRKEKKGFCDWVILAEKI